MKKLIVASTSTIHGSEYLEYLIPTLKTFFKTIDEILFIPYARPSGISYDAYTAVVSNSLKTLGIKVRGIHEFESATKAIKKAQAIFVGGGNTFVLVNELYKQNALDVLTQKIERGASYLGTSAGSNICGLTMQTTNDMPIVYPPSYRTLGLLPFNINAHYLDTDPNSKHKGETRETRIKEFHNFNAIPVLGLREGSWLEVNGDVITLEGDFKARLFRQDKSAIELEPESVIIL